jgi:hypothetical protein
MKGSVAAGSGALFISLPDFGWRANRSRSVCWFAALTRATELHSSTDDIPMGDTTSGAGA